MRKSTPTSYILKNEIYLADGHDELVDSYVHALGEMANWVEREGDSAEKAAMAETARAYNLRDKLKARVRKVLEES